MYFPLVLILLEEEVWVTECEPYDTFTTLCIEWDWIDFSCVFVFNYIIIIVVYDAANLL